MGKPPLSRHNGQTLECKAHRFANADKSIDRAHFCQHMGRVGSLTLPMFEPPLFFKESKHRIQQELLCPSFNQARAKIRQDGKVKAGIGQFSSESIRETRFVREPHLLLVDQAAPL